MISMVIPLWNEEDVVDPLMARLWSLNSKLESDIELVLVNDGSMDNTHEKLLASLNKFPRWKLIKLSRNFGQQAAYRAGLDAATGDAVIFLDADLQDPPEIIPDMIRQWREGAKLVTACRKSRAESPGRKLFFGLFHELFHRITGGVMPKNSGTFALMDRAIVDHLKKMPELSVFFPALRSWVGYRQAQVWYDRSDRQEGKPKQTFMRLLNYAWDGVTSFSEVPLKMIGLLGFIIAIPCLIYAAALIVIFFLQKLGFLLQLQVLGFTTLAVAVFGLGGIQLICLGVIGEYLGRVYREVKGRPPYIVEQVLESPPR